MLYAMLAACASLILVLAVVPRSARACRLARLFRAQEAWAEAMDRKTQPHWQCPLARGKKGIVPPDFRTSVRRCSGLPAAEPR